MFYSKGGLHFSIKLFALFSSDDELRKRLELRSNGEFRDFEISKRLNDDIIKLKYDTEFQIDTTGLSATETAEIILHTNLSSRAK